ncbi:nucleoside transporter [Nemania sp. FL0916]|nr:nucleoside transporter [Nemania sp. FL0916]
MEPPRPLTQRPDEEQEYTAFNEETDLLLNGKTSNGDKNVVPFSWVEYEIFALLGMAMLWAWNMFLAASPYFQGRFEADKWVLQNFQSAIIIVSTITNFGVMITLANSRSMGRYSFRINLALYINAIVFALLTVSTTTFLNATPGQYLCFILVMVASTAWAAGLIQNGAFALTASLGRPEYMQAILAGQSVAGVLPPVAQIVSVLVTPPEEPATGEAGSASRDAGSVAFTYFLTAVAVSIVALLGFIPLGRRHNQVSENRKVERMAESFDEPERDIHKPVTMLALLRKLHWCAAAIFACFAIAMLFPVLTPKVVSVAPSSEGNPLLEPAAFIPLAFFFLNVGDLTGRASALSLPFRGHPAVLFVISIARVLFLPLYALCNINGRGAVIPSDLFYLMFVQFPHGLANGWLASNCMMVACNLVDEHEREATGSFMALCLMSGLTFGGLMSFVVARI